LKVKKRTENRIERKLKVKKRTENRIERNLKVNIEQRTEYNEK
jgi:hypothetical protein